MGVLIFALIYCWYYSAGFTHGDGIYHGIYDKGFGYWFEQYRQNKIIEPFVGNFLINAFYESWWVIFIAIHLIFFYQQASFALRISFLISVSVGIAGQLLFTQGMMVSFFKFVPLFFHAITATTVYLLKEKQDLGVSAYAFFVFLLIYCFLREKDPWMAAYPLLAGIIFFSLCAGKNLTPASIPLIALFIALNGFWAYRYNLKKDAALHLLSNTQLNPPYQDLQRAKEELGAGVSFKFVDNWNLDYQNMTLKNAFEYYWKKEPWSVAKDLRAVFIYSK